VNGGKKSKDENLFWDSFSLVFSYLRGYLPESSLTPTKIWSSLRTPLISKIILKIVYLKQENRRIFYETQDNPIRLFFSFDKKSQKKVEAQKSEK